VGRVSALEQGEPAKLLHSQVLNKSLEALVQAKQSLERYALQILEVDAAVLRLAKHLVVA
jgi:hypothetical protein